jgi:hypothetical protein
MLGCSRVYVERPVYDEFVERLTARTKELTVGDPTDPDTYVGPVIDDRAVERYERAVASAEGGTVRTGGTRLSGGAFDKGTFVAPDGHRRPPGRPRALPKGMFLPVLVAAPVDDLDQALEFANDTEYGLTAGIFSEDQGEIERFFDRIEAGVVYANRKGGATTGAWPGCQSFAGWKASGSSGKGGLGPYYVQQFLREQSRTVVVDAAAEDVEAETGGGRVVGTAASVSVGEGPVPLTARSAVSRAAGRSGPSARGRAQGPPLQCGRPCRLSRCSPTTTPASFGSGHGPGCSSDSICQPRRGRHPATPGPPRGRLGEPNQSAGRHHWSAKASSGSMSRCS